MASPPIATPPREKNPVRGANKNVLGGLWKCPKLVCLRCFFKKNKHMKNNNNPAQKKAHAISETRNIRNKCKTYEICKKYATYEIWIKIEKKMLKYEKNMQHITNNTQQKQNREEYIKHGISSAKREEFFWSQGVQDPLHFRQGWGKWSKTPSPRTQPTLIALVRVGEEVQLYLQKQKKKLVLWLERRPACAAASTPRAWRCCWAAPWRGRGASSCAPCSPPAGGGGRGKPATWEPCVCGHSFGRWVKQNTCTVANTNARLLNDRSNGGGQNQTLQRRFKPEDF